MGETVSLVYIPRAAKPAEGGGPGEGGGRLVVHVVVAGHAEVGGPMLSHTRRPGRV